MDSILTSIKKLLNIDAEETYFDGDIVIYINSALMVLNQIGVGPAIGFSISDATATWTDFLSVNTMLDSVKSFVHMSVKLEFDPPSTSFGIESLKRSIERYEWRIMTMAETSVIANEENLFSTEIARLSTAVTDLNTAVALKAEAEHTHVVADITDLNLEHTHVVADITDLNLEHTHDDIYYTKPQVDTAISVAVADKSLIGHTHDDLYLTDAEGASIVEAVDTALLTKAPVVHAHDDIYYQETEVDTMVGDIETILDDILGGT